MRLRLESKKNGGRPVVFDRVTEAIENIRGAQLVKLDGYLLKLAGDGQFYRLTWREAHGDQSGVILQTRDWSEYLAAVERVIREIHAPIRKPIIHATEPAKVAQIRKSR